MNNTYIGTYLVIYTNDHLEHHGILGQKWGVRRFQNNDGSYTALGRERYGLKNATFGNGSSTNSNKSEWDHSEKNHDVAKAIASGFILPTITAAAVGARVAAASGNIQAVPIATAVGAGAGVILAGSMAVSQAMAVHGVKKIEKANKASGEVDEATGFYRKEDREYTREEDIKSVNPGFDTFDSNNHNNCYLCTLTYDLRKRGYAVSANKASHGFQAEDLKRWYPKAKVKDGGDVTEDIDPLNCRKPETVKAQKEMIEKTFSEIEKQGPGARGYIGVKYFITTTQNYGKEYVAGACGHAMAYEVNSSGKIEIIDAQTNKVYSNPRNPGKNEDIGKLLGNAFRTSYARLDNVAMNPENIKEVAH